MKELFLVPAYKLLLLLLLMLLDMNCCLFSSQKVRFGDSVALLPCSFFIDFSLFWSSKDLVYSMSVFVREMFFLPLR